MDIRIYGQVATCISVDGHQCKLLDIDKKARQVQVVRGKLTSWVPYERARFNGKPLKNSNIRVSRLTGQKKRKTPVSDDPSHALAAA